MNTISDRISGHAADIDGQLKENAESPAKISVAIDESTDITNIAQLSTFKCGVDASLIIIEEFVQLVLMTGGEKLTTPSVHLFVH